MNASIFWQYYPGTAIPFGMGWLIGYVLYVILDEDITSSYGTFGLFVAVSFCITAFPVLARILTEKHLTTSEVCNLWGNSRIIHKYSIHPCTRTSSSLTWEWRG